MESFEQRNLENDGTSQFLQYLSLPAEPSDREDSPQKRTKLDNTNLFKRFTSSPEYINIEPIENSNSRKQEYSSLTLKSNPTNEMRKYYHSVRQRNFSSSVWDIVDPQGSVRGLAAAASAPKTSAFSIARVSSTAASAPKTPVFSTARVSFKEKPTKLGKKLAPIVYCNCTLYPPADGIVPKPIMKRPLGCKTVVITGLPMSLGYDTIMKLFGYFGRIHSFSRKKKDNFFQVTYYCESSIDKVIEINGYTLVTSNGKETIKGTMQVNYAAIWAERLEYDNRMKVQQTEKTENELVSIEPQCSEINTSLELPVSTKPSKTSPYLPNFSRHNIKNMLEEIQCDNVNYSSNTLIKWMEEGKCKKYAEQFFDILCAMQSSVTRLVDDTAKLEESLWQHQGSLMAQRNSDSLYFAEILKVFNAATSKVVFKNFSFKMRNQIEEWKTYIEDLYKSNSQDLILEVVKEKAVLSDVEVSAQNSLVEQQKQELKDLIAENERLKKELRLAQREASKRYNDLIPWMSDETKIEYQQTKDIENDNHGENGIKFAEKEVHLIAMIAVFLSFHPSGESTECICEYLLKIDPTLTSQNIECFLRKLPTVFKEQSVGISDDSKKKWTVCGI